MTAVPVSGGAVRVRPGALALLRERALSLAEAALTPLVTADVLDLFHPLRAGADLRGRIVRVQRETADATTIVIRPGKDWAGHVPGQYVRVGVDVDGVRHWRAYSLTHSAESDPRHISITVKAMSDGAVSPFLVHRATPGLLIHLDQATGDFVAPDPQQPVLFVTAGSGITPVMGMLRNRRFADAVLIHSALSRDEVVFGEELRARAARGELRLVEFHTDRDGMLDVADLPRLVPDLAERTTYACGPIGLLDALAEHHEPRGLVLRTERFRPSVVVAGEGGTLSFDGAQAGLGTLEADGATPLLDVAEAAGALMPSGCRMGVCFGCVLPLKEGAVRDLRNGELTMTDPMSGPVPIQTCISAAAGPCTIEN